MNDKINQTDLQSTFKVLKVLNNKSYVLVPELAKELKVSKIELAQYIIDNQKLFYAENCFSYKQIKVKRCLWPNDKTSIYTTTETVPNKSLGMGLLEVYLNPVENYRTNEWLINQISAMEKYIHISEIDNYGMIEGYVINTDMPAKVEDDKYRAWKWRNTVEKLTWLKENGFTHSSSFVMGGFGDSYTIKRDHAISLNKINELKSLGWATNKFQSLANYIDHAS